MTTSDVLGLIAYGMTVGVALAAPIGPINVEIIKRGLRNGFKDGWMLGLGALTADTLYAVVIVAGLTPFVDSPAIRVPLFLAGGAMLCRVGWSSLKTARAGDIADQSDPSPRHGRSFLTGFMLAVLNPMGIVYWFSVGSALVAEAVDRVGRGGAPVLVGGVFFGILCWVTTISIVAQVSRKFVTGKGMRWITGISGVIIIGFGLWFVWQAATTLLNS